MTWEKHMRTYLKTIKDISYRKTKNSQKVKVHSLCYKMGFFCLCYGTLTINPSYLFWFSKETWGQVEQKFISVGKTLKVLSKLLGTALLLWGRQPRGQRQGKEAALLGMKETRQKWGCLGPDWPTPVLPASSPSFLSILTHSEAPRAGEMGRSEAI